MADFNEPDPEVAILAVVAAPIVAALCAGVIPEITDRSVAYGVAAAVRVIAEAKAAVETARDSAVAAATE